MSHQKTSVRGREDPGGKSAVDSAFNWEHLIKQVVARFARGNISAQNARILLPAEQASENALARRIARKWKARGERKAA